MGAEITKCQCACNKDEKVTEKFDVIENPKMNNLGSFSNKDNINNNQGNMFTSNNSFQENANLRNYVQNKTNPTENSPFPSKTASIIKSQAPPVEIHKKIDSQHLQRLQAYYKGWSFRAKYPSLKQRQIDETNQMIKDLTDQYTKFNLKRAESLYGTKFDKNGWKTLYANETQENNNKMFNFNYGKVYNTRILIITEPIPGFYSGYVNIDNEKHSYGVLLFNDGSKYEGYFRNNLFHGWGRLIDSDGTLYEGNFANGKINGKGIKKSLNGNLYIGDFVEGLREGKGKEETNEHVYEGEFKNDKKNGSGKLEYKLLKDTYEGEFKDNCITGIGFYTWANKDSYKGSFVNGKMHGKGLYKWPDGGEYYGDYVNNIKEGKGVFKWVNGKVFEGPFRKGRPNGIGKLRTNNREVDVEFKEGKLITNIKDVLQHELKNSKKENTKTNDKESDKSL